MGVLSGLFGVGGGVISQPGMRLLGLEPLIVIGTALPVIIPGAASGTPPLLARGPDPLARGGGHGAGRARRRGGRQRRRRARARRRPPAPAPHRRAAAACRRTGWPAPRRRVPPDEPLAETDAPEAPDAARPEGTDSAGRCAAHRRRGRRPVGPARHRRRRDHGPGVRALRPHGGEGGDRDVARVRRARSRSPAPSPTRCSATSTGASPPRSSSA